MADWKCEVQLPAEHKDRILECWRDVWYDQLKQQISQTEVEKEAFSTASQKTSQDYLARRPPEPLPHEGGPDLQRGRGARHRELGGPLQVRVPLGALLHSAPSRPPGPPVTSKT